MSDSAKRFAEALARFDAENGADRRRVTWNGEGHPKDLLYGRRMSEWIGRLDPRASEALRLAARAQHLGRYRLPREQYPQGRRGYLAWRNAAKRLHAQEAGRILDEVGYSRETVERVRDLVQKRRLSVDAECQTLEDAACLVFFELDFAGLAERHDDDELVSILRKTWAKMSPRGRSAALGMALPPRLQALVVRAVKTAPEGQGEG